MASMEGISLTSYGAECAGTNERAIRMQMDGSPRDEELLVSEKVHEATALNTAVGEGCGINKEGAVLLQEYGDGVHEVYGIRCEAVWRESYHGAG